MSWPDKPLRDVVLPTETRDPRRAPDEQFFYVDISAVDNELKALGQPKRIRGAEAPTRARKVIRADDTIVATTRPYLNQVAVVPRELDGQICSTGFCVLRSNGSIEPGFLYWFAQTRRFLDQVLPKMRGSSYPAISDRDVLDAHVPLPPLEEQRLILARLDTTLGRLRNVANQAGDVVPLVGNLEVSWVQRLLTAPNSDLRVYNVGDIANVAYGVTKNPTRSLSRSPVPYLRVANVQHGYLDMTEIKEIDVSGEELQRWRLLAGDVLLCEGNSSDLVGRAAMFRGEIDDCVHQNHVIRLRPDPKLVLGEYLLLYINSPQGRSYFRAKAKKTTNLASINSTEVRAMSVPLPSISEQQRALKRANILLDRTAALRQQHFESLALIESTRQVVLNRAFGGGL